MNLIKKETSDTVEHFSNLYDVAKEKGIWEAKDKTLLVEFEYDEDGRVKGMKATHVATLHKN